MSTTKFQFNKEAVAWVRGLPNAKEKAEKDMDKVARMVAQKTKRMIRTGIYRQMWPMAPLSSNWLARKAKLGLDSRILLATKAYADGFSVVKLENSHYAIESEDPILSDWLEFGTKRMPARPHIGPATAHVEAMAANFFDNVVSSFFTRNT